MESAERPEPETDGIFRLAPAAAFSPAGQSVVLVEVDGEPRFLVKEDAPLSDVVADLDLLATHLVRHGIWRRQDDGPAPPPLRNAS